MSGSRGVDIAGHDGLANLALLALVAAIAMAGVLRVAGEVAAFMTGAKLPPEAALAA